MSAAAPIQCGGCSKRFAWKADLAGKRVKCKCGHVIVVHFGPTDTAATATAATPRPQTPRPQVPKPAPARPAAPRVQPKPITRYQPSDDLDGLLALAADADAAAADLPLEIRDDAPTPVVAAPRRAAAAAVAGVPLAYQRGTTVADRQKAKAAASAFTDPTRDVHVPVALLVVGMALYVGYFGYRFEMNAAGLAVVTVGLSVVTAVKTALLVGAALVLAGPLGVGFGSLWSAVLKLAAIAVFTDGATAWIDHAISHAAGGHSGGGVVGYGAIGWPVSILIYWGLMAYLFSMDATDARWVVCCLGVLSRILRFAIAMCLLSGILNWGGVTPATAAAAGVGASPVTPPLGPTIRASALSARVDDLMAGDFLVEGRKFIASGNQMACTKAVTGWYAAGCPNVWFEMSGRDINGRRSPEGLVVQLPDGRARRAAAYAVLKQYDADMQLGADPSELKDTGESYLTAGLR